MKPPPFAYCAPVELADALASLAEHGHDGKVLAGGQSLIPLLNMRLAAPAALVDITRIEALDTVEVSPSHVRVGAGVTHERLRTHVEAATAAPIVTEALDHVAHTVIRNRGTVVGSIVHADPAAELPGVLALLGGWVELRSVDGVREVPASEFLLGPLESDVRPGELAVAVGFPRAAPRTSSAFVELARRHGDYALVGVGVTLTTDPGGAVTAVRAVCIGAGPRPEPITLTEPLSGGHVGALDTAAAVEVLRDAIDPDDDVHSSGDYRRHLAGVLLDRALARAADRSGAASRSGAGAGA